MPDDRPIVERPNWPSIEEMESNPPTYQHVIELAVKWHNYAEVLESLLESRTPGALGVIR